MTGNSAHVPLDCMQGSALHSRLVLLGEMRQHGRTVAIYAQRLLCGSQIRHRGHAHELSIHGVPPAMVPRAWLEQSKAGGG